MLRIYKNIYRDILWHVEKNGGHEDFPVKISETKEVVKGEKESPTDVKRNHELDPDAVKREVIPVNQLLREPLVVNEEDEGFIGPKLPRLITRAECDAFHEEIFSKLFPK